MIRSMTLTMLLLASLASSGIAGPVSVWRPPIAAPPGAVPSDEVKLEMVTADEDSVGVLLELVDLQARQIEHLTLDLRTCRMDSAYWHQKAEDLDPEWWEEVLSDERLWFLIGALASAWAMD